ncbi:MAG: hypothetical protein ABJ360_22380 [Roseobacter sp.]
MTIQPTPLFPKPAASSLDAGGASRIPPSADAPTNSARDQWVADQLRKVGEIEDEPVNPKCGDWSAVIGGMSGPY